ncbi:MAG: glycosyltransferase family 2 protein [Pseudomonadota bacterium]
MRASGETVRPAQHRRDGAFRLSVIVPMFNEEGSADAFFDAVLPVAAGLTDDFEILCVDDGSRDATSERVRARMGAEPRIGLIRFSRNFGKEAALTAALDNCDGDAVVSIDADLQMRPEVIADMVTKWRDGWDVVAATRADRATDSGLRAFFSRRFYLYFNRISETPIPPETGDFRLLDREVVLALRQLPERTRFMKGLFAWVGFSTTTIDYDHGERHAGTSSFKLWKLWNFALDGITSFSTFPLRVWSYVGFASAFMAFIYGSWIVIRTLIFGIDVPGYASLLVFILFLGGIQLISLGVMGEYLGRLLTETKRRPIYLARSTELPERDGARPADDKREAPR